MSEDEREMTEEECEMNGGELEMTGGELEMMEKRAKTTEMAHASESSHAMLLCVNTERLKSKNHPQCHFDRREKSYAKD